jgi:hypothetical protein
LLAEPRAHAKLGTQADSLRQKMHMIPQELRSAFLLKN